MQVIPTGEGTSKGVESLRATRSRSRRVHRPIGPSARSRDIWVNASCGSFVLRVHHGPYTRPSSTFFAFSQFHILLLLAQRSCRCVALPSRMTQRPLFFVVPRGLAHVRARSGSHVKSPRCSSPFSHPTHRPLRLSSPSKALLICIHGPSHFEPVWSLSAAIILF